MLQSPYKIYDKSHPLLFKTISVNQIYILNDSYKIHEMNQELVRNHMLHNNWYIIHKNPQHNAVVVVLPQIY
jgi:hypothetical protein